MFSRPPFSCSAMCDTHSLKGLVVFFSPSDVSVALTSPFSGITGGSHTPAFAMFPKNRNIDDAGAITPKGFAAIEHCLVAAYRLASALYENREALYARLLAAERAVDAIREELESFEGRLRAEKRTKKGLLKQGLLPESEYAAFLNSGCERIALLQDRVRRIKRGVFAGYTGIQVACGQEEQAAAFVAKYFSPHAKLDGA
jgi:hypothetical protein